MEKLPIYFQEVLKKFWRNFNRTEILVKREILVKLKI